jgi:hypothetical protein
MIDVYDDPDFEFAALPLTVLFVNLLALYAGFPPLFADHFGDEKIVCMNALAPPPVKRFVFMLAYNFYAFCGPWILAHTTMVDIFLHQARDALATDDSDTLYFAPFVLVSLLRHPLSDQQVRNFVSAAVLLLRNVEGDHLDTLMWAVYFLFKNSDPLPFLTEDFVAALFSRLECGSRLAVRVVLYAAAHMWLVNEQEVEVVAMLQRVFPLRKVVQLIGHDGDDVSSMALLATANYAAFSAGMHDRVIEEGAVERGIEVLTHGSAAAKLEAAAALAAIVGSARDDDLLRWVGEDFVQSLIDVLEMDSFEVVRAVLAAIQFMLPVVPRLSDFLLQHDFDTIVLEVSERFNGPYDAVVMYEMLTRRRQAVEEGFD